MGAPEAEALRRSERVWVAYGLHASSYLVKPRAFGGLERCLQTALDFRVDVALLPGT